MIYHAKTKTGVIEIFRELGATIQELHDHYVALTDLEQEQKIDDWIVVTNRCRICGHKQISACPSCNDLEALQCHKCENMTASDELSNEDRI